MCIIMYTTLLCILSDRSGRTEDKLALQRSEIDNKQRELTRIQRILDLNKEVNEYKVKLAWAEVYEIDVKLNTIQSELCKRLSELQRAQGELSKLESDSDIRINTQQLKAHLTANMAAVESLQQEAEALNKRHADSLKSSNKLKSTIEYAKKERGCILVQVNDLRRQVIVYYLYTTPYAIHTYPHNSDRCRFASWSRNKHQLRARSRSLLRA